MLMCMMLLSPSGFAQEQDLDPPETAPESTAPASASVAIKRMPGRIPGQMALPVAERQIAATLIEESLGRFHGAVLILHGLDGHIDSVGPVATLRRQLPEHGWTSMTIQLVYQASSETEQVQAEPNELAPDNFETTETDSEADAETEVITETVSEDADELPQAETDSPAPEPASQVDNQQRISAAMDHLETLGAERLILIALGESATDAVNAAADNPAIDGLVMFSVGELAESNFDQLTIPVLEIVAQRDTESVRSAAKRRFAQAKRQQSENYSQQEIPATDRSYRAADSIITGRVRAWLYRMFIDETER